MKVLVVLFCLLFSTAAIADSRSYSIRSVGVSPRAYPACGYGMRHKRLVKDDGKFYVNMAPFEDIDGDSQLPGWATLRYLHADGYSRTLYKLYANDRKVIGLYILHSRRNGKPCADVHRVRGVRVR